MLQRKKNRRALPRLAPPGSPSPGFADCGGMRQRLGTANVRAGIMKTSRNSQGGVSLARIRKLRAAEAATFRAARPKSAAAFGKGIAGFFGGVPMHWMNDWPTPFPVVVDRARGATILDIDGISLDDFCLGDTGSMFGHSPPPVARAIRRQAGR